MHDPSVVAWEISVPVPRLTSWGKVPDGHRRFTIQRRRYHPQAENSEYANKPMYHWFRPCAWYVWVGSRQLKMRRFATIWHEEPGGADALTVCSHWRKDRKTGNKIAQVLPERHEGCDHRKLDFYVSNAWKWHVHHWKLQFPWLQSIRTYLFQKCAWCGGPSRKKDWVNCTYNWDGAERKHFWSSSPDLYHGDCMTPEHAWRSCSCEFPLLPIRGTTPDGDTVRADYGKCSNCDRFFGWGTTPEQQAVYAYIREHTPVGSRMSPEVRQQVEKRWEIIRALKEKTHSED